MKLDRKLSKQDLLPPSTQRSQRNSKCPRCHSQPKKSKQGSQIQVINQKKPVLPCKHVKSKNSHKKQSKSCYEETEPTFQNQTLTSALKKKDLKRQAFSYQKLVKESRSLEDTQDHFFEKKYKKQQNELLSTKSRLYEHECVQENLKTEIKKYQKENQILKQKMTQVEKESQQCIRKAVKYKQMARNLKISLEAITSQVQHVKQMSQDEIKGLQQSMQVMEKVLNQRSLQYGQNLKTILQYLQKIQKMSLQGENQTLNQKLISDLMDLITQFQRQQIEDDESLKESLMSNGFLSQCQNNNDIELVFSQTTNNDFQTGNKNQKNGNKGDLSYRTKKLLNDYEHLRYESERLKEENKVLKQQKTLLTSHEQSQEQTNYNSKDSEKNHQLQSLSVADILQYDSVQKLNNQLEEKNKYLEEQINLMRFQMQDLTSQTKQLLQEREQQQLQVKQQRSHLMQITEDIKSQTNSAEKYIAINHYSEESNDTKTKKYYDAFFKQQRSQDNNSFKSPEIRTESDDLDNEEEKQQKRFPLRERKEQTQKIALHNVMKPSHSIPIIESQRSALSKGTSVDNSRQKTNIFKRNCYLESEDKENMISARDHNLLTIDFNQENSNKGKSFVTQTMTSPCLSNFNIMNQEADKKDLSTRNYQKKQETFAKRPMSLGSTSTNMINEKAKALRDEISTLDEEILQLQTNLRKAILKKDEGRN